ncbi:hypothetical protein [Domibacillus indicus]|uniref:hypothetical protein n=1 Tax=Domibacillus indicus TaxID=1437523 RepID=UPI000617ECBA|nr:hypothetical protein [Domibacillus indicus]
MEDIISRVASLEWLTMGNAVKAVSYTFFFVTVAVFAWQVFRCIRSVKHAISLKKVSLKVIGQSLITLYIILVILLSAGINGLTGIFWVFSFIGFSLTVIFWIDRSAKRGTKPEKLRQPLQKRRLKNKLGV